MKAGVDSMYGGRDLSGWAEKGSYTQTGLPLPLRVLGPSRSLDRILSTVVESEEPRC